MSADNRICLMETQWGWAGWHGSCSVNYYKPEYDIAQEFSSKEAALEWARKEADNIVILEGGITYIDLEEQMRGLKEVIEDAQTRLDNIIKWGTQFPVNNDLNFK